MRLLNQNESSTEQWYLCIQRRIWKLNGCIRDILVNSFISIGRQWAEEFEKTMLKMTVVSSANKQKRHERVLPAPRRCRRLCGLSSSFQSTSQTHPRAPGSANQLHVPTHQQEIIAQLFKHLHSLTSLTQTEECVSMKPGALLITARLRLCPTQTHGAQTLKLGSISRKTRYLMTKRGKSLVSESDSAG